MASFKKSLEQAANDEDAGPLFAFAKLFCELSRGFSGAVLITLFGVCLGWLPATNFVFLTLAVAQALNFGLAMSSVWANHRATEIVLDR